MAAQVTEKKLSLTILINVKAQKVLFAYVGKDFVDFIFQIMSLPLSSITKLLNEKSGMVGSLGTLYKSIESLSSQYYESNLNKDSVLNPRVPVVVPFLSFNDAPTIIKIYRCQNHMNYVSYFPQVSCPSCKNAMVFESNFTHVLPTTSTSSTPGYVKGEVSYMVKDNLHVKPMDMSLLGIPLVRELIVRDSDHLEEKEVEFGIEEVFCNPVFFFYELHSILNEIK